MALSIPNDSTRTSKQWKIHQLGGVYFRAGFPRKKANEAQATKMAVLEDLVDSF